MCLVALFLCEGYLAVRDVGVGSLQCMFVEECAFASAFARV